MHKEHTGEKISRGKKTASNININKRFAKNLGIKNVRW